jgi:hypothetical protein
MDATPCDSGARPQHDEADRGLGYRASGILIPVHPRVWWGSWSAACDADEPVSVEAEMRSGFRHASARPGR